MKFQKFISAALAGILLFSSIPVNVFAETVTNDDTVLSEDIITSGSAVDVVSTDIGVDFNVTGQWADGFNGEITITNLSDKVIENWQIQFEFSQEITNIWNAIIVSHENSVYNIKNAGGNNNVNIPVGGSVTFGFTGSYDNEIIAPSNIELIEGRENADNADYSVDFYLLSQWDEGYTAQITVTNNTDTDMEAWRLEFDFGNEITSIWNAVIENVEEDRYCVANAGYNSVIPAKGSITFGFNGNKVNEVEEPSNYVLTYSENPQTDTSTDTGQEEIDYELDTDGDGLPDWIESMLETDIENVDTDDDGLSDYNEIMYTGTDPLKYDTDDNGICDYDEDTDGDGLTNGYELEIGTNPSDTDTDGDGLSDYDEIYVYNTDPLKYDTDGDTLVDGDEIKLGLNPSKKDTDNDGILDCDEKILQTVTEEIACEDLPGITDISVSLAVSGVIDNCVDIENMYNKNVLSSDLVGITGAPIDLTCTQDFESAEIIFTYDETQLDIEPENLGILWFDEDNQFYEVMETELNEQNHTISMTTTHFSEYTVVDLNAWFKAWEEKIDYGKASLIANNSNWQGKVVTPQQLCDEYNEFFGYDNAVTLKNVLGACEEGDIYALLGLIQLSLNNGEIINYPCLFMGLMEFQGVRFAVGELSTIFPVPMCGGWVVSYVNGYIEYDFPYYEEYGNIWPAYSDVVGYGGILYENTKYFVPAGQVDTTDDDEDGLYDIYELTGMRIANGQVIYTKTNTDAAEEENETLGRDSDGDGLLDGEEIIRYDTERGYFVMKSDPNISDSDNDGYKDIDDPNPFVSDIRVWKLNDNTVFIKIPDKFDYINVTSNKGIRGNYGGNQSWFEYLKDTSENRERFIADGGCGVISASDIAFWYTNKTQNIDFDTYSETVRNMANNYIKPWDWTKIPIDKLVDFISNNTGTWGVNQYEYMNGIKKYFKDELNVNIDTNYISAMNYNENGAVQLPIINEVLTERNKNKILGAIKDMLNNDIPIPMMIGYNLIGSGVDFYSTDSLPETNNTIYEDVDAHWINVVALIENRIENEIKLIISSWGEKYVIDFNDFFANYGFKGGIVYVRFSGQN